MNKNRFVKSVVIATGLLPLFAIPGKADSPHAAQTARTVSHAAQSKRDAAPTNDFAGLDYTDDQRAELSKIHEDTESQKAAVVKDQTLTADQKDAMLLGYTRMEYSRTYKVLSPLQQRQVRQRILARRAAEKAAGKQQPPRN
jgi:hypothetical protein